MGSSWYLHVHMVGMLWHSPKEMPTAPVFAILKGDAIGLATQTSDHWIHWILQFILRCAHFGLRTACFLQVNCMFSFEVCRILEKHHIAVTTTAPTGPPHGGSVRAFADPFNFWFL